MVSHPENGEIVAAVGSTGEFTGFNRVLDAKRQVGSLLKPVIYMQALQSGRYTWASPIQDTEIVIRGAGVKDWKPKNYSGGEKGIVSMQSALANSYNLAAVRLGWEAGLPTFINNLHRLGVQGEIPRYPSILLGAVTMSPMDILGIYQNFATGGYSYPTRSIRSVVNADGELLERYGLKVQNTIDPATAYLVNYGLQQVMTNGTGRAAYNTFPREMGLAGKSGTTNDARDSWFAGYSGNYLAVVWLGEDNNKPIGLTGSSGALPVWINVIGNGSTALKVCFLRKAVQVQSMFHYFVAPFLAKRRPVVYRIIRLSHSTMKKAMSMSLAIQFLRRVLVVSIHSTLSQTPALRQCKIQIHKDKQHN